MIKSSTSDCIICQKIRTIKNKQDPYFVLELPTGYITLGYYQFFRGYTLFLCKKHVKELHELSPSFKLQFLKEMSLVAEAVFKAFKPIKLNYELLGNTIPHLHWHLFPRYRNDPLPKRPVWCIDPRIIHSEKVKPTSKQIRYLKTKLLKALRDIKEK